MGKLFWHVIRLAGTAGVCLGMLIVTVLLESIFGGSDNDVLTVMLMAPLMITVVCVVNQALYDVLDMKILHNGFGRFVKVIIFGVVTFVVLLFCLLMNTDAMGYEKSGKFFPSIFHYAGVVSGGVATFMYCWVMEERDDEGFWYIPLISWGYSLGAGLVLRIILAIIPGLVGWMGWLAFIASVGLFVYFMLANGIPYTDTTGVISTKSHRSSGYSGSSSSSSGYRSSSSSSSGGYRSSSSSSSSSTYEKDTRKAGFGDLRIAMSDVAKRHSKTVYISCGCTLFLKVTASVSGGTITFYVGGECKLSSQVQSDYDVNSIKYDIERELKNAAEDAVSAAEREIDTLRTLYNSYDSAYSINASSSGVKFTQ